MALNMFRVSMVRLSHKPKYFVGTVFSDKMDKTISVSVNSYRLHPKYRKVVRTTNKFFAHDGDNLCRQGDIVEIGTCRPISKKKRFYLTRIIKAMPQ